MTSVTFDLRNEVAAAGLANASGHLICRFVNEIHDDDHFIITTAPFRVDIVDGVGTADVVPTPTGNALSVRSYVRGVRNRTVLVPDVASAEFCDLVEVDPATLAEGEPDPAWWAALDQVVYLTLDPDENDEVAFVHFPAFMTDPDDDLIAVLPMLEGA